MYTRKFPFHGSNQFSLFNRIKEKEPSYNSISNEDIIDLLKLIFKKKPQERISINQLKEVRFFRDVNFAEIFQEESPILRI